jgi:hypothetical protein
MTEMERIFEKRWRFVRDHERPRVGRYTRRLTQKELAKEWFERGALAHLSVQFPKT